MCNENSLILGKIFFLKFLKLNNFKNRLQYFKNNYPDRNLRDCIKRYVLRGRIPIETLKDIAYLYDIEGNNLKVNNNSINSIVDIWRILKKEYYEYMDDEFINILLSDNLDIIKDDFLVTII
tara:strand:- start:143 stop:508 length:366 start_codon:yes stop_codon:yes gene_type:complete